LCYVLTAIAVRSKPQRHAEAELSRFRKSAVWIIGIAARPDRMRRR